MIRIEKGNISVVAPLFEGLDDSMVTACLQGYMGDAYVRAADRPDAALIVSGEYSFFGGDPGSGDAKYLVAHLFDVVEGDGTIAIFADAEPGWERALISCRKNNPKAVPRYGILNKDYEFDLEKLQAFIDGLPEGFTLAAFDEAIYWQALAEDWSKEFCKTFASAGDYLERGFGYAALYCGKLVSGASTMTVYDGGAETQVATREDFRRKGLAMPCAAAFIKECARRKIRPCWDAANLVSKNMALKLGYEYKGEYTTIHMSRDSAMLLAPT